MGENWGLPLEELRSSEETRKTSASLKEASACRRGDQRIQGRSLEVIPEGNPTG